MIRAKDEELFIFAQEKDWQEKLNPRTLERVRVLMEDYEACGKRIPDYIERNVLEVKADAQ